MKTRLFGLYPIANAQLSYIVSIALLVILQGCYTVYTPERVAVLKPIGGDVKWLQGQGFQMMGDSTLKIILAFERGTNGKCVFDVEIVNFSNSEILILPELFYYEYKKDSVNWVKGSYSDDPEKLILQNDLQFSAAQAAYKTENSRTSFYYLFYGTSNLVGSISDAFSSDRTREKEKARQLERLETEAAQNRIVSEKALNETSFQNQRAVLESERESLRLSFLRKTTLRPSFSVRGKIQLPFPNMNEPSLQVSLNIGRQKFSFPFSVEFFPKLESKEKQRVSPPYTFY